ncbi:MAG: tryptophan synthase subunit alpha [Candidatus Thermoplasmatota archaeon]|nr:tryptophan synthase subunit alpha [Candidatus Thermoplasmatota archaeon]
MTANYPSREKFLSFVDAICVTGVDYVEIGLPSSNPIYDGPTIRSTHQPENMFTKEDMALVCSKLQDAGIKVYALSYYRDILNAEGNRLVLIRNAGFDGVILPDLLIDYFNINEDVMEKLYDLSLEAIPFFNPGMPDRIIKKEGKKANSWIYCGLMPSTGIRVPYDYYAVASRMLSLLSGREVNFGFGIRTDDDIRRILSANVSGIAVGTVLIDYIKTGNYSGFRHFLSHVRGVIDEA